MALQDHPAVFAACAVGVPDEKTGERIKAFVVLKQDVKGVTGYDLIRWCRDHLASYKIPHYIYRIQRHASKIKGWQATKERTHAGRAKKIRGV